MRRFELTLKWRENCENREEAENILDEIVGDIRINFVEEPDDFELVATDVQILPREAGGIAGLQAAALTAGPSGGMGVPYPNNAPRHPWDDGAYIFPPEHPLRKYEEMARQADIDPNTTEEYRRKQRQTFLAASALMLTPPEEEDG